MCLKGERSWYLCLCIQYIHTSQIETWNDSSLSLTDMRAYGGRWNNWLIGPGNRLASLRGHKSWKFQNKFLRGVTVFGLHFFYRSGSAESHGCPAVTQNSAEEVWLQCFSPVKQLWIVYTWQSWCYAVPKKTRRVIKCNLNAHEH